jgi:isoleucyl-tRNA synthetase
MSKDYKDTLNLPNTDFAMKANLPQKEPELLKFWQLNDIYQKMCLKGKGNDTYLLHDGPPYANGHIHLGHALNKILKDIIVKFKTMNGFYAPYVPGWDCHGLPIEHEVDKRLGQKKYNISVSEKRTECRQYASKFVDIQREEFKRLAVLGDWNNPYLTMTPSYESAIVREFAALFEKGYVYKGKKPVHWCSSCITALAEAEVEYFDKKSPSVYVAFPLKDNLLINNANMVIWTTTPWTLPANLAIAVHPQLQYAAFETDKAVYIVAQERLNALKDIFKIDGKIIKHFKGSELEGLKARHPFIDRDSLVVTGDFVSIEEGTGLVHIAPGHGMEDYETGLRYGLDIYAPVDKKGQFTNEVEQFQGLNVFTANEKIIELLEQRQALLYKDVITHSYPHCWRCKRPVIFRATEQWFVSMEHNNLRQKALSEIQRVSWIPKWGEQRLYGMVKNRPDWCISRQRSWGVPITVLVCKSCGHIVNDKSVMNRIVELISQKGADVWFTEEVNGFITEGYSCIKCGRIEFEKEMDILDVWFESGVSHAGVLENDSRHTWPASLYLEGSDQHRGWFQSSLLASVASKGRAPYESVLTHGFVVDGQGKKMSKSYGNVLSPEEVVKQYGAEILRLWVSAADYKDDMRMSNEILKRLVDAYRKIRNTCRFLLGNTNDFDPNTTVSFDSLMEIDRFAMSRLQSLIGQIYKAYQNFEFHEVFHRIYNFCVVDMSAFYLDVLKDRLYVFKTDSKERRASQWVLRKILIAITKMMAPVLSFTAEEIWQFVKENNVESVFLADFPKVEPEFFNIDIEKKWETLLKIRNEVNKALEIKRKDKVIGNSLEAKIKIYVSDEHYQLLMEQIEFLPTLFIVSASEVYKHSVQAEESCKSEEIQGLNIVVQKADGNKCQRCWNWSNDVGTYDDYPELCGRCFKILS